MCQGSSCAAQIVQCPWRNIADVWSIAERGNCLAIRCKKARRAGVSEMDAAGEDHSMPIWADVVQAFRGDAGKGRLLSGSSDCLVLWRTALSKRKKKKYIPRALSHFIFYFFF